MSGNVQAVERAAAVLTLLASSGRPLDLADIAAAVGLPKTTVHGLLSTLRSVGWVEQQRPSAPYRIARELTGLARTVDAADLRSAATPWLDQLAAETGLEVLLTWREGPQARVIQHVYRPDNSPQRLRIGEGLPLHATAAGKVLLARGRDERRDPGPRLERFTRSTVVDHPELERELLDTRSQGYATESGEYYPDAHAIAVPVRDPLGDPIAALAVLGERSEVLTHGRAARAPLASLVRVSASISRALADQP